MDGNLLFIKKFKLDVGIIGDIFFFITVIMVIFGILILINVMSINNL